MTVERGRRVYLRADEIEALLTALDQVLAGEVLDGFDDDSDEERDMRAAMARVGRKLGGH